MTEGLERYIYRERGSERNKEVGAEYCALCQSALINHHQT